MNLDFYFPTPIWWIDTGLDNQRILDYCIDLRKNDPDGREVSNFGGWQSNDIDCKQDLPELVEFVMNQSDRIISDYGFDRSKTSLWFGNSWVNINKGKQWNQIHHHHGSFLSGVYYVQATSDSGNIYFYKDFNQSFITTSYAKVESNTALSAGLCYYPPRTGRLLLFPSNLLHSVDKSRDEEDRISIAFNIGIRYD